MAPARRRVREVAANVAECRSSEQRIANRVGQGVAIRMREGSFPGWNFNATQNQLSAFNQPVNVIPKTNAGGKCRRADFTWPWDGHSRLAPWRGAFAEASAVSAVVLHAERGEPMVSGWRNRSCS